MTTNQPSTPPLLAMPGAPAPPPLPLPRSGQGADPRSTGGREELPEQQRADRRPRKSCGTGAVGSPLRTYLVFMAFFVALWALGGFGHFWPAYPALGWGLGLVLSGQVPLPGDRRRGAGPGR